MRLTTLLSACLLLVVPVIASAEGAKAKDPAAPKPEVVEKRAKIDEAANKTLAELREKKPGSQAFMDKCYGWAAFDATKVAVIVSGGGGSGVAVEKESGKRIYMKMGTGGVGVGLGGQNMRVVFFFETKAAFDKFIDSGWQAQAAATAAAGNEGANAEGTFSDGMAYYVMTDSGLMLNADIAGTKYSKNPKLN